MANHSIFGVFLTGAACATAAIFGGCTKQYSDADIRPITLAEVRKLTATERQALLVDPRAPSDYEAGHIPGARNIALTEIKSRSDGRLHPDLASRSSLVVYGDDPSSAIARVMTKRLMEAGHDRVWLFAGGLAEWRRAGLPIDPAAPAVPPAP